MDDNERTIIEAGEQGVERARTYSRQPRFKGSVDSIFGALQRWVKLAEDLAQEVFLKIYKARKSYQPLARFETWLHRIVYNVVVNAAHSRKRRQSYSLEALREKGWEEGEGQARADNDPARVYA